MKRKTALLLLGVILLASTVSFSVWAEAEELLILQEIESTVTESQAMGLQSDEVTTVGNMYSTTVGHMYGMVPIGSVSLMSVPDTYTTISFPSIHSVTISTSGTVKWFRFTAPESKRYVMKAVSSGLDTQGFLYDVNGNQLASNNDGRVMHNQKDVHVSEVLTAGNIYYFKVQLRSSTPTGTFSMYFYEDDCPDGTYTGMSLEGNGVSTQTGVINYNQDRDMYQFTPPVSGNYTICAEGNISLVASLYNSSTRNLITSGSSSTASSFTYNLTAGTLYYIEARANSTTATGDYRLNVIYKDNISALSAGTTTSVSISTAGMAKVFSFTPTVSGAYTMVARSSNLKTAGHLFDSTGRWLASCRQGRILYANINDFNLHEHLTAGQTYYLGTRLWESTTTGSFSMDVYQDDCTGGTYVPSALSIGTGHSGSIEYARDSDMYQLIPEISGSYLFEAGTNMIGTLYNASRTQLATSGSSAATFTYSLNEGQTYLFEVRHKQTSGTGTYQTKVSLQQSSGVPTLAEKTSQSSSLSSGGTVTYKIVPAQSKSYTVITEGTNQGSLYNGEGAKITDLTSYVSTSSKGSITLPLIAGQSYYIKAGPITSTATVSVKYFGDDVANGQTDSETLSLNQVIQRQIDDSSDTDVYAFTPSSTGIYLFGTDQSQGVQGKLYHSSGSLLVSDTNGGEIAISSSLTSGITYYLEITSHGQATGNYQLGVSQPGMDIGNATELTSETEQVSITTGGAKKIYRFVPETTGLYTLKANSTGDTVGGLYNFLGGIIQDNDDAYLSTNTRDFCVTASMTAGNTYYISTGYYNSGTGNYSIYIYQDDYFDGRNSSCEAIQIGSKSGVINHPNDLDVFKFTASQGGSHLFQINGAVGTLMNSSGSVLAETSQGVTSYSLTENATYYFKVSSSGATTGAYTLTIQHSSGATNVPATLNQIVDLECKTDWESPSFFTDYTVIFQTDEFEPYDLCGLTYKKELEAGVTAGGVTILSVVINETGETAITFRTLNASGVFIKKTANVVRLKAKKSGNFIIYCSAARGGIQ